MGKAHCLQVISFRVGTRYMIITKKMFKLGVGLL